MTRYLTKSRFKVGLECPRKLYYTNNEKYENTKINDSFLEALAEGGFQVGELAKLYYPGGYDITEEKYDIPLQRTNELLKKENVIIYEAAVKFKNLFIRIDVLVKKGNYIKLIEVKAKSFKDQGDFTNRKGYLNTSWKPYLYDVAFQQYVLQNAFPEYQIDSYLMLADKNKTASVSGLNQKFQIYKDKKGRTGVKVIGDTSKEALGNKILTEVNVNYLVNKIYSGEDTQKVNEISFEDRIWLYANSYEKNEKIFSAIGKQCIGCEFKATSKSKKCGFTECWKEQTNLTDNELKQPLLFELWRGGMGNKDIITPLIENNIYHLEDITEDYYQPKNIKNETFLSPKERRDLQIFKHKNKDNTPYIDIEGLKEEILTFNYPLHFIDFETSMAAIPFYEGRKPYEQTAFQFSHHILYEDGTVKHAGQWLSTERGYFPNFDFVRALKKELENDQGTIFRYHNHENTVLYQIAEQLKSSYSEVEDAESLLDFIYSITHSGSHKGVRDMVDLYQLVLKYYYHPLMKGSNSIKDVLPAVLNSCEYIKNKYSKAIYGKGCSIPSLNFDSPKVWIHEKNGKVISPYKLLPPLFEDLSTEEVENFMMKDGIADGGAALTAFAKIQFTEMSDIEKEKIVDGLLRYCELDTLAMVMIFESWLYSVN